LFVEDLRGLSHKPLKATKGNHHANLHLRLFQKVERRHRVTPDIVILQQIYHSLFGQWREFWPAISRIVQLCNARKIDQILEDNGLEPVEVLSALISIEMRTSCLSRRESRHILLPCDLYDLLAFGFVVFGTFSAQVFLVTNVVPRKHTISPLASKLTGDVFNNDSASDELSRAEGLILRRISSLRSRRDVD
jgi:hypothetical protein